MTNATSHASQAVTQAGLDTATSDTVGIDSDLPLAISSFGLTDLGQARTENEDQFLIAALRKSLCVRQSSLPLTPTQFADDEGHLLLVADGMGGHRGGGQASALTIESIQSFALNTLKWFLRMRGNEGNQVLDDFRAALEQADARVIEQGAAHPELRGMGTTATLAYFQRRRLFVVHAGDSRCYLLHGGQMLRVTRDHTIVQEMVEKGTITSQAAEKHRLRHMVTNIIGGNIPGVRVEAHKIDLHPGDRVLLCSDGLSGMLSDERISAILAEHEQPRAACERLVAEANAAGGKDNITVVVARFD
jgi:serine/threonine protein phosphatase PrpC